ncbi:MAG: GNAT family N-acetyltransferase [Candidatus Omnitrophica bacterium]|nr:GNAT family N-acetyltransferase [Candidatus Omnitrophota bacterium]
MKFSEFRHRDLGGIVSIEKRLFPEPFGRLVFLFLSSLCNIYVCKESGVIAGYLVLGYDASYTPHIYRLGVLPSMQGRGVGSGLLARFARGPCTVAVKEKNTVAIEFYKRHGFKKTYGIKKDKKGIFFMAR